MKKYSKEEIRNQIAGLGESSIRKNYYQELMKKQEALEAQNKRLEEEVALRKRAEESLIEVNDNLELLVKQRTIALEEANDKLKESYETLKKTQDYLIESEKLSSLGTLVVGISHEINTPLGVALTASSFSKILIEALQRKGILDDQHYGEEAVKLLESEQLVLSNIKKSIQIINDFKKITSDQTQYEFVEFEARAYIEMLVKNLKYTFNQTDTIQLDIEIGPNLIMQFYPGILSQIVTNLISNTMQHGFGKTDYGIIQIAIKESDTHYILDYEDDGIGISKAHITKVFDPFFTTARNTDTSGLGLYVIYNLVTKLKGKIAIASEEGLGVHFTISLPKGVKLED